LNDEERSEMRYVMWIAGFSESSSFWTHIALFLFGWVRMVQSLWTNLTNWWRTSVTLSFSVSDWLDFVSFAKSSALGNYLGFLRLQGALFSVPLKLISFETTRRI